MFDNQIIISLATVILGMTTCIILIALIHFQSILIKLIILEVLSHLVMSSIALWSFFNKQPIFINICLPLALIMFLSIVAYYQFILFKGEHHDYHHR